MSGKLHLPVISFVLGGVFSHLSGFSSYLLLVFVIVWIFTLRHHQLLFFLSVALFICGSMYLAPVTIPLPVSSTQPAHIEIISNIKETPHILQMIGKTPENDRILLVYFVPDDEMKKIPSHWHHGARCRITGEKVLIKGATNPGQFDYQQYMANQQVFSQMEIKHPDDMNCEGRSVWSYLYEWRKNLMETTVKAVGPETGGWVKAMVFGEKNMLDEELEKWFRDFNLTHILAISGLHISLFMGMVYLLICRLGIGTIEQAKYFLVIMIPVYAFTAGAAPSVMRAACMALLIVGLSMIRINIQLSDVLSVVAMTLLIFSPSYFTSIAFQFSFLVTFSIILSLPILGRHQSVWVTSAIISLISQLSILPVQLKYFYEFNPLSIVANLLLVPYFSFFVIPCTFLLMGSSLTLESLAAVMSAYFQFVHETVLEVAVFLLQPFRMTWIVGEVSSEFILLYYFFFLFMMGAWVKGKLMTAFTWSFLTVGVLVIFSALPYLKSNGTVTMLDVGQGDSFVIELPYRRGVFMIDAAGPPVYVKNKNKIAEQVILPYLKSRGIASLDGLFISHKDTDHSGSAQAIIDEFHVDRLFVHPFYKVDEKVESVIRIQAGEVFSYGKCSFHILHPETDSGDTNDNSLVIKSDIGGLSWLFTGDISRHIEEGLGEEHVTADVLKVGHHGSHTSTSEQWLEKVNPETALISAGRNNRYGHPHKEVMKSLSRRGIIIYQTSLHGAVQYNFSGLEGTFIPFLPYNAIYKVEK